MEDKWYNGSLVKYVGIGAICISIGLTSRACDMSSNSYNLEVKRLETIQKIAKERKDITKGLTDIISKE